MTIFGFIWICICIFAFLMKDIKHMLFLTMIGMVMQSNNVLSMSTLSCGPQIITSILFVIKSYMYNYHKEDIKIKKSGIIYTWIFFGIYIFVNFLLQVKNFTIGDLLKLIMILLYIFTSYRIYKISKYIEEDILYNFIKKITMFILIVGYLTMLTSLLHLPIIKKILNILIYNDVTTDSYFYKSSTRFFSTFMEPSYLSGLLSGIIIYFLIKYNKFKKEQKNRERNKSIIILIFSILAMILTRSSTGYVSLGILFLIYALKNIKKRNTFIYCIIGIVFIGTMFFSTNVFNEVLFDKFDTGSARVREQRNTTALNIYKSNPIIGNGYKTLRASSIVYDIMANLGTIGLILYFIFVLILLKRILKKSSMNTNQEIYYLLFGIVVSQIIACPDLDFSAFWLGMYFVAFNEGQIKKVKGAYLDEKSWNINVS